MTARRRRGLLLLAVALASGGLAASQVHDRERRAAEERGPSVEVLVAARDLAAGSRIGRDALAVRRVPARFAPPDALVSPAGLLGAPVSVRIPAGSYLSAALFEGGAEAGTQDATGRGERVVTVGVAGGGDVAGLAPGRVDILVSTDAGAAGGRTTMALAGADLLRVGGDAGGGYPNADAPTDPATGPTTLATLRVSLRAAIYLTAADNFAREIRLLARPPGDRSRAGVAISQGQL